MRAGRTRFKLGMEVTPQEPRVIVQLDHFDVSVFWADAAKFQPRAFEGVAVFGVKLITVAMPLADTSRFIDARRQAIFCQLARVRAEAHFIARLVIVVRIQRKMNDGVGRIRHEFRAVRVFEIRDIACVLDDDHLHAERYAEEGNALLAGILDGGDFSFGTSTSESAGNQNCINIGKEGCSAVAFHVFGIDKAKMDFAAVVIAAVRKRFVEAFIAFGQGDVFSDDRHGDGGRWGADGMRELFSLVELRCARPNAEMFDDAFIGPFVMKVEGNFVNIG